MPADRPGFWQRRERYVLALVALCALWTLPVMLGWWGYVEAGALTRDRLWRGQLWRLLSSLLLHADWVHLLFNGLSLYFVGAAVARGLGRRPFTSFLVVTALAGQAASVLLTRPDALELPRMGISGGVFGLLGLVLGVEYADRPSWGRYLRRPNVVLVLFFLVLNTLLALGVFDRFLGMSSGQLDHAAHCGGFAAGLVLALLVHGPRRFHVARGSVAAALLVGLPLLYALHPWWDPTFHVFRGGLAEEREDPEAADDSYARALELDAGHPIAVARLARLRDDPDLLSVDVRTRAGAARSELIETHVTLARRRADTDPERAQDLLERVAGLPGVGPGTYALLARVAERNGQLERAYEAMEQALEIGRHTAGAGRWRYRLEAVSLAARLAEGCLRELRDVRAGGSGGSEALARAARGVWQAADRVLTAAGRAVSVAATQPSVRRVIEGIALGTEQALQEAQAAESALGGAAAAELPAPPAAARILRKLAGLFQNAADNPSGQRSPRPDLRESSARWLWRAAVREGTQQDPGTRTEIVGRFTAAAEEAREAGNEEVLGRIRLWFARQRLPLPD
ncbi:MAG: rhomboid family intramembrane serine protease [Planctomycetota bacterium]